MAYPGYVYNPYPRMITHPSLSYQGHVGYTIVNSEKEELDVKNKLEKSKRVLGTAMAPDQKTTAPAAKGTGTTKKLMFSEG